ncbi:hypothetical protein J2X11_002373 [Aeromicrobium panaciterrae]|uniref:LPXTG cell wall anchor domain-containing protein n=1 Tax=Aeromicrobium panaciterrae TaxID=363861 RepID=A0ABU1UQS6_9ACTN|nr:hypothetical protein [Aeromicrobium panaciterrae]MDR7087534.1 hypothetical protein [Aeromicrobium panaciterrae]
MKRFALVLAMLAGSVFIAASPGSTNTLPDGSSSDDTAKTADSPPPADAAEPTDSSSSDDTAKTADSPPPDNTPKKAASARHAESTKPDDNTLPDDTDHKIDICHLPPGNPANGQSISVDFDSIINGTGHGNDGLDIIPPFDYTKQGVPGSFPGQNWTGEGQSQYNNGCDEDQPNQPDAKVENKDETGDPNCTEKTVTTTFYTRSTPYVFDENSWTWVLGTPGEWVVDHTTSRAATVEECPTVVDDTEKTIDICHLPPGNPANGQSISVDFDSIINGTGHGNDGLDIIPPFDYTKQGVPGSFPGQNWTVEGQAQYGNDCDDVIVVTPIAPTVTEITACGTDGLVVLPTTEGVTYAFDPAGESPTEGPWKVTATADEGFVIADGASTSWNGNLGAHTTCATPVAPSVTDIEKCGEDGNVELPTTEGVTYAFDPAGDSPTEGPWKVTATANEDFAFPAETQTMWSGDLGDRIECALPVPPTVADSCDEDGSVTLPVTEGVAYAFTEGDGVTGEWTVMATPQEGFGFADDTVAEWSGTVTLPEQCAGGAQIVVAEVVVDEGCPGSERPTPTVIEGVVYTFTVGDGVEGPWEITATAEEGYELVGQQVFIGDAGAAECGKVVHLDDEDDALLPDTGGAPLGPLLVGGLLTVAGVAVLGRQRFVQ